MNLPSEIILKFHFFTLYPVLPGNAKLKMFFLIHPPYGELPIFHHTFASHLLMKTKNKNGTGSNSINPPSPHSFINFFPLVLSYIKERVSPGSYIISGLKGKGSFKQR